jgi:hypothetical protein
MNQRAANEPRQTAVNTYARQNYQQIKEQEAINQERERQQHFEQEKHRNLVARQKQSYDHVASNGYGTKAVQPKGDDVEIKVFVRECDPDARMFRMMESDVALPPQEVDTRPIFFGRRASAQAHGDPASAQSKGARGEVPKYLQKRKAEMEAEKVAVREEVERQKELSQYPPGHRPVTDEERAAILDKLSVRKKELEAELGRLPMRFDTQAVKNKRAQIEGEMNEIDAAERKFSVKKQLFVPI